MVTQSELRMMIRQEVTHALEPIVNHLKAQKKFEEKRYFTIKETAKYLGIGVSTVHYWVKIGKLRKHYIKGSPQFDKKEIDADLQGNNINTDTHI